MSFRHRIFRGAADLGATALVAQSPWRQRRLVILCYHGVSIGDEHEWNPELYMPVALFRDRMRRLREGGYEVLRLADAVERLQARDLPPKSVVVTFDDGAYDFAARALPVLREFDIHATNYVPSVYTDFARPVFEPACAYVLWKGRATGRLVLPQVTRGGAPFRVDTRAGRAAAWDAIEGHARQEGLSPAERDDLLRAVAEALEVDYDAFLATRALQRMQEAELRALPPGLVDLELHTHRHEAPCDRDAFRDEILENRAQLARLCGGPGASATRAHFCYPSGRYDLRMLPWLRELGVRSATTCVPDIAHVSDEPLLLPRYVDTASQPTAMFEAWISGLYAACQGAPSHRRLRLERRRAEPRRAPRPAVTTPCASCAAGSPSG